MFPITCGRTHAQPSFLLSPDIFLGDIGHEPDVVSKNLKENFRLVFRWGCVLLLDEADVFLAKRDRENLKRNSLVSNKYPGIQRTFPANFHLAS